jgi:hypothetical protein
MWRIIMASRGSSRLWLQSQQIPLLLLAALLVLLVFLLVRFVLHQRRRRFQITVLTAASAKSIIVNLKKTYL